MDNLPTKYLSEHYKIDPPLPIGKGSQGLVFLSTDKEGQELIIKELNIKRPTHIDSLLNEVENLKKISYKPCHKNIVCYKDVFRDPTDDKIYLVLDYYPGETLDKFGKHLEKDDHYFDILLGVLVNLLQALEYVHSKDIVHGDIKLENIQVVLRDAVDIGNGETLVSTQIIPVLIDFGLSCTLEESSTSCKKIAGTPNYLSPEIYRYTRKGGELIGLTKASDIWALGITFYALLNNGKIWPKKFKTLKDLGNYIISEKQQFDIDTPNLRLNNILNHMLVYDPKNRLTASELLKL